MTRTTEELPIPPSSLELTLCLLCNVLSMMCFYDHESFDSSKILSKSISSKSFEVSACQYRSATYILEKMLICSDFYLYDKIGMM